MDQLIVWSPGVTLEQIEKQVIMKAMSFFRGNKTTTATALGISVRTLDARLVTYGAVEKRHQEADELERQRRTDFLARSRGLPGSAAASAVERAAEANAAIVAAVHAHDDDCEYDLADEGVSDPAAIGGDMPAPGVRAEPAVDAAGGVSMPLPNRGGVSKVLPTKAAPPRNRKVGG